MRNPIHTPSVLVGLAVACLLGIVMGQQIVGSPAVEVVRVVEPQKVLGIPAPDEWIDIESNTVGQPATTYTVPAGHTLTIVGFSPTPPFLDSPGNERLNWWLAVDGVILGEDDFELGGQHSLFPRWISPPGFLLREGQVLTVARTDPGQSVGDLYADDSATYTLRAFLEKFD